MGNEKNDARFNCVPPGQMDQRNVQLYEWRTVDNKPIVNKPGKVQVDVNSGVLWIRDVTFSDSAQFLCSAVLPSEKRVTFTHNLVGMYRVARCLIVMYRIQFFEIRNRSDYVTAAGIIALHADDVHEVA